MSDDQIPEVQSQFTLKIILIGNSQVGKSAFIHRFIFGSFLDLPVSSSVLDTKTKDMKIDSKLIRVNIWDTAGQVKYKSVTKNVFNGVHGVIALFDITNEDSFNGVKNWVKTAKEICVKHCGFVLVGNKLDLKNERIISKEEAEEYAKKEKMEYYEASSKNDENVDEIVFGLCKKIIDNKKLLNGDESGSFSLSIEKSGHKPPKRSCC